MTDRERQRALSDQAEKMQLELLDAFAGRLVLPAIRTKEFLPRSFRK